MIPCLERNYATFKSFIYCPLQCSEWLKRIHRWSEMFGTILYSLGDRAWPERYIIPCYFPQYYDLLNTDFDGLHEAILIFPISLNNEILILNRACWLEYTSNLNTELHLYFCHFFFCELQNEDTSDTKGWDNMGQGLSKKCTLKWVHQLQRPFVAYWQSDHASSGQVCAEPLPPPAAGPRSWKCWRPSLFASPGVGGCHGCVNEKTE